MVGFKPGSLFLSFIVGLVTLLGLSLYLAPAALAHANYEHSTPAANASLPPGQPPPFVQVWFTEKVELRFSELQVVDKSGNRVDAGNSHGAAGDPKSMLVDLKPGLPDGAYTVIYKNASAEDGHIIKGNFSFLVGAGVLPASTQGSPLDLAEQGNTAANENSNPASIGLRWLTYLANAALVGAMIFALLIWRAAVGRARATKRMGPELSLANEAGLEKIQLVAWVGVIALGISWLAWWVYQAATYSSQDLFQLFGLSSGPGPAALTDFLFNTRYGIIWIVRLVLIMGALMALSFTIRGSGKSAWLDRFPGVRQGRQSLLPAEETGQGIAAPASEPLEEEEALRTSGTQGPLVAALESRQYLWWAALLYGAAVMLTTSLNSHAASISDWGFWAAVGSDWLHLLSTGAWVGGLMAMAAAVTAALPALRPGSGDRTRLLASLIPAFSQVVIVSVMILLVSGTFNAALQLADVSDLLSTPYGVSLTVKIALLVPLLLLGAYNLLVVTPRMRGFARSKKAGPQEGAGSIAAGTLGLIFRRVVWLEIGLTVAILLAAGFLTSSAPPKGLSSSKVLYYQTVQGGLKIDLAISPGTLGETSFEVRLTDQASDKPVADAALVDLRVEMQEMDMGITNLELKPVNGLPGRYLGEGPTLSMVGTWHANLLVQRNGFEDIHFPVTIPIKG
jgi:putative copper export protein/methionine-rich copper-binding protein CopC